MARSSTLESPLPVSGRSVICSRYGMAAASQPLAAQAASQVLGRGGNAVDAAIAANAAQGVMEPMSNGIGGDLFAIVHVAREDRLYGINASGWSPAEMTLDLLASRGVTGEIPLHSGHSVTVPGAVAGWAALHERFGALPLAQVLAPAIHYAQEGFPVMEVTAGLWSRGAEALADDAESRATFLVGGRPPRRGEIFRNPALAESLRRIAGRGRSGFYEGETAQAMVEAIRRRGGVLSLDDLAAFQPEWVEPLQTTYRGWTVSELPPNGQGIAALEMLNILQHFPLREWGFHTTRTLHAMIEAKKLAYADLLRYVGDPAFAAVPVAHLLSEENAAARAKMIDMGSAAFHAAPSRPPSGSDTIYLAAADAAGNVVSLIQSNYHLFGSGITPEASGFVLQNRACLFTLEPHHPNTVAPRKRPLHTIIPGFLQKGQLRIGFGIMGRWNQAQAHAQFVVDVADFDMDIQQALEAGRFTKDSFEGRDLEIESTVPAEVREELAKLGHELVVHPPRTASFGFGQAVLVDRASGVTCGASDPRHDGAAIPAPAPCF
jgi:gamma-glutamyltranspeptidase/glutathione hydrolase